MLWTLIWAAILGALVGAVARILVKSPVKGGCGTNIAVSAIGAVIGSTLLRLLGGAGITGLNLYSFFVALIGAVIFLAVARAFTKS